MKQITFRKVIIDSTPHGDLVVARPQGLRVPGAVMVQRCLLVGLGGGYPRGPGRVQVGGPCTQLFSELM
eukprot:10317352-Alexandrium_andersonii.AAC.1